MAKTIVFTKKAKVNGQEYKEDDVLSVSESIFKRLVEDEKVAKIKSEKKTAKETEAK